MPRRALALPVTVALVAGVTAACGGGKKPAAPAPADAITGDATGARPPADAPPGTPAAAEVTFHGAGVTLAGTYWGPADPTTSHGCAIFVHQLSSTRAEYAPVIEQLRGRAHLLAFDLRGHGASTRGDDGATLDWKAFATADWELIASDLAAATELMVGKGADRRCVLVGASIGSSAVLLQAAANPDSVRALVLLSPGLAYRGVKTPDAARANRAPVLVIHSQEPGAADAAGALAGIWRETTPPVAIEVIAAPGDAHGMKIVAAEPELLARVVGFIAAELAK